MVMHFGYGKTRFFGQSRFERKLKGMEAEAEADEDEEGKAEEGDKPATPNAAGDKKPNAEPEDDAGADTGDDAAPF